jgi:hypothetical protein
VKCSVYNIESDLCAHCKGPAPTVNNAKGQIKGFLFFPMPKFVPQNRMTQNNSLAQARRRKK